MPTSRRTVDEPAVVVAAFTGDTGTHTGGDEVPTADARDDALAALLVTAPPPVVPDPAPPVTVKPHRTNTTVTWDTPDGGARYLVTADVYRRVNKTPEDVLSARRGDVVVVPADDRTASDVRLGHLTSE